MKKAFTLDSALFYMGSIILAIYASDFHKLLLNICSFFGGNIAFANEYGRMLDAILALLCAFNALLIVLLKPDIGRFTNVGFLAQFVIFALLSFSLLNSHDMISLENYARFAAGNLLIFFAAIAICRTPLEIRRVWAIWIFTSVCLSIISICLFGAGINWSSARSAVIPVGNIRTGYFSSISLVYIFANLSTRFNSKNLFLLFLIIVLMGGILTSGSKASIIIAALGIGIYLFIPVVSALKVPKQVIFIAPVIIFLIIFAGHVNRFESTGFIKDNIKPQSYFKAGQNRIELMQSYLKLGSDSPIFGNGISASYSLEERTHSVLMSVFVQIGVLGLLAYIVFLISVVLKGLRVVNRRNCAYAYKRFKKLSTVTFIAVILLILKSEITSDIPGNRELWLFAGMLLSIYKSRRMFSTQATREHLLMTDDSAVKKLR